MAISINKSTVAEAIPFDNDVNGFESDNVQSAIEESGNSVSPGYSWTRSGVSTSGSWLQFGQVPSNKTGQPVGKQSQTLASVEISNEDVSTFDVTLFWHEGSEINLTPLLTASIIAARSAAFDDLDFGPVTIPAGKQLAVQVSSGSGKNVGVTVKAKGFTS